jgi:hypothetical protein
VVQVQLCKYYIEIGDSEKESAVWSEINMLRFAMLDYGNRSPIGSKLTSLSSVLELLMNLVNHSTARETPTGIDARNCPHDSATATTRGWRSALSLLACDPVQERGTDAEFPSWRAVTDESQL